MGTTDYGTQSITFQYQEPATSLEFNKLNYQALPTGIYNGGTLSKTGTNIVQVSTITFVIQDSSSSTSIKVETSQVVSVSVSPGTPFIVLRWEYVASINNYVDFLAVAYDDIQSDDLILGRCIYEAGVLQSTFDYTRKSTSSVKTLEDHKDDFRVQATEPISNRVYVNGGTFLYNNIPITISSGNSPIISDTTLGRIDLVYIDDDGNIQIEEGTDSATPSAPLLNLRFVIAEIHRGASKTVVNGNEITQVNYDYKSIFGESANNDFVASSLNRIQSTNKIIETINGSYTQQYENLLTEMDTTNKPKLAGGCTIKVDEKIYYTNGDVDINGSPSDGDIFIEITPDTGNNEITATATFIAKSSLTNYTWNESKAGWYYGTSKLLPFMIILSGSGTVYDKYFYTSYRDLNIPIKAGMTAYDATDGLATTRLYAAGDGVIEIGDPSATGPDSYKRLRFNTSGVYNSEFRYNSLSGQDKFEINASGGLLVIDGDIETSNSNVIGQQLETKKGFKSRNADLAAAFGPYSEDTIYDGLDYLLTDADGGYPFSEAQPIQGYFIKSGTMYLLFGIILSGNAIGFYTIDLSTNTYSWHTATNGSSTTFCSEMKFILL